MSGPDISSDSSFNTQSAPVSGAKQTTSSSSTSSTNNAQYRSTLQRSEEEALASMMLAGLAIVLPTPELNAAKTIDLDVAKTEGEIINTMWKNVDASLQQIAANAKADAAHQQIIIDDIKKDQKAADYLAQQIHSAAIRQDVVHPESSSLKVQVDAAISQWMKPETGTASVVSGMNSTDYPSSAFIAGAAAISLSQGLGPHLTTNPVADILQGVGPASGLPGDYQAAAAMVAALLYNGAVFKATFETIDQAAKGGKPVHDLDFAKNYAKNIIAIVTAQIDKGDSSNPQRAKQNQMIRLMLTTMALSMVYRLAYGSMTGKEFEDLLNGNTQDLHEEVKPLITQLLGLLKGFLPSDPKERAATIANLKEYIEDKDSTDNMLRTTHLFSALLKNSDFVDDNRRISTTN